MLQKKLGRRIAELRKTQQLTQVGLAKKIGCSGDFVSLVKRGVNAPSVAGLSGISACRSMWNRHLRPPTMTSGHRCAALRRSGPTIRVPVAAA
jgi:hypothetical protein